MHLNKTGNTMFAKNLVKHLRSFLWSFSVLTVAQKKQLGKSKPLDKIPSNAFIDETNKSNLWSYFCESLKELWNCILWIIYVWPLFCSVRAYVSLHFLPILLVKLDFRLSVFWFFMFLFLWILFFIFSVQCFESNVSSKHLITFFNFVFTSFKQSVKI